MRGGQLNPNPNRIARSDTASRRKNDGLELRRLTRKHPAAAPRRPFYQHWIVGSDDRAIALQRDRFLKRDIHSLQAGGVTSLYDAIFFSCKEKLYYFPPPEPYLRRVMIIVSDGQDNYSQRGRDEAMAMAQRAEVTIFPISTNRSRQESRGDKVLEWLAQETGGRAFFPFEESDLSVDFQTIGRELRSQYSLAYFSTNNAHDGTFRKIAIDPLDKNVHVRAKSGYFAPSQ